MGNALPLKRKADRIVAQGADLPNAEAVFECLSRNTKVCLFYVTDIDVSKMDYYLNKVIMRPIPGTMASHHRAQHNIILELSVYFVV